MSEKIANEFVLQEKLRNMRKEIRSFDELTDFLKYVEENCNCGYGEAPRAMAQAALAVAWYLADRFGITGFQSGFVMWDFIRDWAYSSNKCGLRILDYDNMLYPQYEDKFCKTTINRHTWSALQKEAKERLRDSAYASPTVIRHWESIAKGVVPFGYTVGEQR